MCHIRKYIFITYTSCYYSLFQMLLHRLGQFLASQSAE
jgi:hypothetical protein